MNPEESVNFFWLIGALVLAVSALVAQRMTIRSVFKALLGWAFVAVVIWLVMTNRPQVESVVTAIAEKLGVGEQTVEGDTVRITMGADGHFWARVAINGVPKRMLVDSGATITALSEDTARAAGIDVGESGFPIVITTANGSVAAQRGNAERVSIGELETRDLGVVVSPAFGDVNVLGMNFLSRLGSWRVEGRTLVLQPKKIPQP